MRKLVAFLLVAAAVSCAATPPPVAPVTAKPPELAAVLDALDQLGRLQLAPVDGAPSDDANGAKNDPASARPDFRAPTNWVAPDLPGDERDAAARARRLPVVTALFEKAGVAFPPADLLFRVFKQQSELEVWASSSKGGRMERIATYGVCRMSGGLGPKRKEGDRQVPEGFYRLWYFLPNSNYWLEMKISYPNESDRAQRIKDPGGAVMIHGNCASLGCVSMTDERAEELWVMAKTTDDDGKNPVHVHIFPSRDIGALLKDETYAQHRAFWENLKEGYDLFEANHRSLAVGNDWRGRYVFR